LYTIHHIPTLRVLDFQRITKTEREKALRLSKSAAGAALEKDVQQEKTFVPGEGKSAQESFATSFTPEQKEAIRQLVANAKSPAEIEEIELSVQRGIFPGQQSAVTGNGNDANEQNGDRKRKANDSQEAPRRKSRRKTTKE
jgi:U2 small nuclear ribonucleoprotein A'